MTEQTSKEREQSAPAPEDERKPDNVTDLNSRSWKFILRKTVREFSADQCLDLAAALTFYAVLALFPAILALVSLLGLIGRDQQGTSALMDIVRDVAPGAADTVEGVVTQLTQSHAAGFAVVVGLAGALWSASGYVGAFGRAMNRIYEIDEGRPFYKLRPLMLLVTLLAVVLAALVALALVVSGPVAQAVGSAIGLGDTAVTIWNIVKWPVMLGVVVAGRRDLVLRDTEHQTAEVSLDQHRGGHRGAGLDRCLGRLRLLRRPLLQLQQDLRLVGRRHRVPAVAVDHQPGLAVRRRARLRDRTRPPTPSRHHRPRKTCSFLRGTPRPATRSPPRTRRNSPRPERSARSPTDERQPNRSRRVYDVRIRGIGVRNHFDASAGRPRHSIECSGGTR